MSRLTTFSTPNNCENHGALILESKERQPCQIKQVSYSLPTNCFFSHKIWVLPANIKPRIYCPIAWAQRLLNAFFDWYNFLGNLGHIKVISQHHSFQKARHPHTQTCNSAPGFQVELWIALVCKRASRERGRSHQDHGNKMKQSSTTFPTSRKIIHDSQSEQYENHIGLNSSRHILKPHQQS